MSESSDKQALEGMVHIARNGLVIGVLFNNPPLNKMRSSYKKKFEDAKKRRLEEFDDLPPRLKNSYEDREAYASTRAFGDTVEEFRKVFDYGYGLEIEVQEDFFSFIQEKRVIGYASNPQSSRFDFSLYCETSVGVAYLKHVRSIFPQYRFVTGENLTEDPNENLLAHNKVRLARK